MCCVLEACPHSRLKLLHLLNAGLGKVNLLQKIIIIVYCIFVFNLDNFVEIYP